MCIHLLLICTRCSTRKRKRILISEILHCDDVAVSLLENLRLFSDARDSGFDSSPYKYCRLYRRVERTMACEADREADHERCREGAMRGLRMWV
jgi:hypothetical protein